MLIYGTPSGATIINATRGTISLQRARRALAAAKHARGWVRKSYLQSAIEHLSDVEWAVLDQSKHAAREYFTGAVAPAASLLVKGLIEATLDFAEVASQDDLESAVAQVVRAHGLDLDVSQL
jgi:hypothetical protein